MKKTFILSVIATLFLTNTVVHAQTFTDLPESNIYHNSITTLVDKGCINGYEDNTFKPDKLVNRAEAIKILLTCLELPNIYTEQTFTIPEGTKVNVADNETTVDTETEVTFKIPFDAENYAELAFTDTQSNQWYIPYLKEAVVRKIITGYSDNTIRPNQAVSKAELYTILYRLTPEDLKPIQENEEALADDIASGYWYYEPLQFAIRNQLLTTNDDNLISPFKELSRAQVSHFVSEYDKWLSERKVSNSDESEQETEIELSLSQEETENDEQESSTEETTLSDVSEESNPENIETEEQTEDSSSQNNSNSDQEYQVGFTETGIASYYGYSFDGRRTASGQILDVEANMAAHKTLPFGTVVKVTNPENGKWVDVTIFDRGPYIEGRIIDLTPSTFEHLSSLSSGIANIELEIISLPE